jgi:hypothetical protein
MSDPQLTHKHDRADVGGSPYSRNTLVHSLSVAPAVHHVIDHRDPRSIRVWKPKANASFTARQRSRSAQCRTEGTDRICTRNGGVRSSTRTPGRRAGMRPGRSRSADGRDGPIDHVRTALAQSGPWAPVTSILITIIKTFLPFPTDLMIVANGASSGFGVTSSCR